MNNQIKVGIDATIIDGAVGGVQNVIESLAFGFKDYSPEDILVYWFVLHHTNWWEKYIPSSHKVVKIGFFSSMLGKILIKVSPYITRILYTKFYNKTTHEHNKQIKRYIYKHNIQVIHTPFQNGYTPKHIPYIYHPHDLQHLVFPENFSKLEIDRRQSIWKAKAMLASLNIVETRFVRNDLIDFWNINPNSIKIIVTPPPRLSDNAIKFSLNPYAIYQAAFWKHKNHLKLIDAFKILDDSNINLDLFLIGNIDRDAKRVARYIKTLNLEHRIKLTGYISREDLAKYINNCEFVIIPSLYESLSLPGFEAIQAQKKIMCSNIPQFRYQFGFNAVYFDPHDSKDIAEKIILNIKNSRENNSNSNLKYFTSLAFAQAICGLYRLITNNNILKHESDSLELLQEIKYE